MDVEIQRWSCRSLEAGSCSADRKVDNMCRRGNWWLEMEPLVA